MKYNGYIYKFRVMWMNTIQEICNIAVMIGCLFFPCTYRKYRTGAGRTGASISVDAALERLNLEKTVDIFNYVRYLRTCRTHMVRNIVRTRVLNI